MAPEFEMHHGSDSLNLSLVQDQAALSVGGHYTFSGDIVTQARLWMQGIRRQLYTKMIRDFKFPANNPMSTNQAFLLGTRAGGLALRRSDLGVINVGAKADIVVYDGSAPGLLGWQDAITAIILHSNIGHIKHVLVDGEWKKKDGELRCVPNQTDAQAKFLASARKVQEFWERTPSPDGFDGVFQGSGAQYGQIEKVDVMRGPLNGY
ncbi:Amidohydro-rel domain-containing protein [Fusarium keratoplasticum]|nr:Amidohydro-rel domain-containing protein [Fusarium keratoplasticum]